MSYPFYNPRQVAGSTLEAMLVGRRPLLEEILADLRRQATSASRQHWLLRGPRGIGKTHLIGMVYHRVCRSPELSAAYLPVWLAETDAFTVYTTAVLLLEVATRLVEKLRRAGDEPRAAALQTALDELEAAGDDPALFEEVLDLLRRVAQQRGQILLVLMENLDAMLAGFRLRREARRFRAVLSEDKELLFLSTTPTHYLRQLSDPAEPLYGHLKERTLAPLAEEEVGELFARFVELTGQGPAEAVGPTGEGRIRRQVLHRLTGGNPRALVMAFSVLSGSSGLRSLVADMETLLDVQTAYFEARLARLAPRERAIVAAMALAPTNLTRQEIARATRLPERSLSTQLKRLLAEGHLGLAVGERGKGTIYELSDGLFRVWYQYRKGRKKLEPLVRFLAMWYTPEDLERARLELEEAEAEPLLDASRMEMVVLQITEALRFARSAAGRAERGQLWTEAEEEELDRLVSPYDTAVEAEKLGELAAVEQQLAAFLESEELVEPIEALALVRLGAVRKRLGRDDDAIAAWDQVVVRYRQKPTLAPVVVAALLYKSWSLATLGRHEEAITVCDDIVVRYRHRHERVFVEGVVRAFAYKCASLTALDRRNEAVVVGDQVLELYGNRQEQADLAEEVASLLFNQGRALDKLGRPDEAIAAYDQVLERYGDRQEPSLATKVARALVNKGGSLLALGRRETAITAYDRVVDCYGDRQEWDLAEQVAKALVNKGWSLSALGRVEEAIMVYDEVVARYGDSQQPALARLVAKALANKVRILGLEGKPREAIHTLRHFVTSFEAHESPEVRGWVPGVHLLLTALEAAQPRRGTRGTKGPAARLREALGRLPPELRESVRETVQLVLFGRRPERDAVAKSAHGA